jgi:hypothetical protein
VTEADRLAGIDPGDSSIARGRLQKYRGPFLVAGIWEGELPVDPNHPAVVCECGDCGRLLYWTTLPESMRGFPVVCGACAQRRIAR